MSHVSLTDSAQTTYRQARSNFVDVHAVAASVSQELTLREHAPQAAVGRPGESARAGADKLATSVPLGVGPGAGYCPVVAVPTVDVRA